MSETSTLVDTGVERPGGRSTLYRVTAPHFVAGYVVVDGRVTEAAPIIRYLIGWQAGRVRLYVKSKGWHVHPVDSQASR